MGLQSNVRRVVLIGPQTNFTNVLLEFHNNSCNNVYTKKPEITAVVTCHKKAGLLCCKPTGCRIHTHGMHEFPTGPKEGDFENLMLQKRCTGYEIHLLFWALSQNLRKASISFVMPVRPSLRTEQLGSHRTDFHEILFEYFPKTVEKIQVSLKSDKNNGRFTRRPGDRGCTVVRVLVRSQLVSVDFSLT